MKVRLLQFNIILLLLGLATGCQAPKEEKELTAIRLHSEMNSTGLGNTIPATVCRAAPVTVTVDDTPFIDERDILKATVVDWMGGFAIRLEFNFHGKLVLENTTRLYPGKRIAILCEFGETRWLAAPLIARPISDGQLLFTPDTTREEAERIVRGLNHAAEEVLKNTFKSSFK